MFTIYKLTSPEKKIYIGKTSNGVLKRFSNGDGYVTNKELYSDIQKFGWCCFKKDILAVCKDPEDAKKLEMDFIAKFNATNPYKGYNTHRQKITEHHVKTAYQYKGKDSDRTTINLCENILKLNGTTSEKTPKIFEQLYQIYSKLPINSIENDFIKTKALLADKDVFEMETKERIIYMVTEIYKDTTLRLCEEDKQKLLKINEKAIREAFTDSFKVPKKYQL